MCVRPPVTRCSVDSVCSCRRRSCKGAVLSDTSHPALITLTHCYSRWLSGTASVQHSHMPAPISHSTGGDSREMRQRYLYVCVCVCVWKMDAAPGLHYLCLYLNLTSYPPHGSEQAFRDTSVLTAMCRQNTTLKRKYENNATRNSDTNS